MIELEVKVLNIDIDKVVSLLEDKNAKKISEEQQVNIVLDSPDCYVKNKVNGYIRIRSYVNSMNGESKSLLTLKKKIEEVGIRKNLEIETEISDVEATIDILSELGLVVLYKNSKKRISYLYSDVRFDIDCWDEELGIKPYLEIEVKSKERLEEIIEEFGFDRKLVSTKSFKELIEEKDDK